MAAKPDSDIALDSLRARLRGPVTGPDDEGYEQARKVNNGMIDRYPAAVVRARDAGDVMAAVTFAREHDLELAIRSGAHGVPGYGTSDGGLVIDMGDIRNVRVDPHAKTARVGGGAQLRDVDHATNAFGLATPAGFISTTGVAGLTLGGGIGPYLSRRWGLTCDNLLSADVVTADGKFVTASARQNEDLFWGLRGGGGNFGVVTSLEFQLHPLTDVVAGPIFFELDASADVMRFYRDFIEQAPREMTAVFGFHLAPPLPFIPEKRHGEPLCVLVACWSGDPADGDKMIAPLRKAGPVVAEHVGRMPYPALQSAFDALVPPGLQSYWKSDFVAELTDEAIAVHAEHGRHVPYVSTAVHLYAIDGAVHDVDPADTAFAHRSVRFALNIAGGWPDPKDNKANIAWVRKYYDAVHPHSGYAGGYTNFMDVEDQERVRANYGASYDRLVEVKKRWDPGNLFRLNQNISPTQ